MTVGDEKDDAALIQTALEALAKIELPAADETTVSRIWLRARLVSLAVRDRPAEALTGAGLVGSAALAGLAALGLAIAFWSGVSQAAPVAALVAVVSLSALALIGGALTLREQVQA